MERGWLEPRQRAHSSLGRALWSSLRSEAFALLKTLAPPNGSPHWLGYRDRHQALKVHYAPPRQLITNRTSSFWPFDGERFLGPYDVYRDQGGATRFIRA